MRANTKPFIVEGHTMIARWRSGYHGYCSCGARTPIPLSRGKERQWHREHKAEVLAKKEGL